MRIESIGQIVGLKIQGRRDEDTWSRLDRRADKFDRPTGALLIEGRPRPTVRNVITVLSSDPQWKGRIRLNQFAARIELDGELITDTDETGIAIELDRAYGLVIVSSRVSEAIAYVAGQNAYHPVREYLEGVTWERDTPRLGGLLADYLGAADTPLHREISMRWAVGAVARIFEPGCKLDTCLILVGPQGGMKSSALQALAVRPAWFSDSAIDFRSKEAYHALSSGIWLYELAELASLRPREAETVKAFLSASIDRYRPAYARHVVERRRSTVFCGTTNDQEFLRDATGSRRFWPVRVGNIDLGAIERDRDLLWAEAVSLYRGDHPDVSGRPYSWWLGADAVEGLTETQADYREIDPWEIAISDWLNGQIGGVTVKQVLADGLKIDVGRITRGDGMRAARILVTLGYAKRRQQIAPSRRSWVWHLVE